MIRRMTPELGRHLHSSSTAPVREIESTRWDACVVGSGPGGSVAAATLAQAGRRVLLIERGAFRPPEELNFRVLDMAMRLGQVDLTRGARTTLHAGNALGGGSIIFGAVAMQPPRYVFEEWAERSGISWLNSASLAPDYAYIGEILSVTRQTVDKENRSNAIIREMAEALGLLNGLELAQRFTQGCRGTGLCPLGCGFDLKGTMTNSFLPIGLETGHLTILTDCEADGFDIEPRRGGLHAASLKAVLHDGSRGAASASLKIRAKHFVLAAGPLASSALLMRSRAGSASSAGRNVWLQPHGVIHALFDQPVTSRGLVENGRYLPMNGVPAIYNFTGLLRERRYYWFASALHPASLAAYTAYLPPEEHGRLMSRFHYMSSVTATLRDAPERSRVLLRRGHPQLDVRESQSDLEALRRCFLDAASALLAVGARRVFLPMLQPPRIERASDLLAIERMPMSYDRLLLYSDHTSGGHSLGVSAARGATDARGRVYETENIHVADSSLFPSACGVSPSWTIMALSRRIALDLAAA